MRIGCRSVAQKVLLNLSIRVIRGIVVLLLIISGRCNSYNLISYCSYKRSRHSSLTLMETTDSYPVNWRTQLSYSLLSYCFKQRTKSTYSSVQLNIGFDFHICRFLPLPSRYSWSAGCRIEIYKKRFVVFFMAAGTEKIAKGTEFESDGVQCSKQSFQVTWMPTSPRFVGFWCVFWIEK